MSSSDAAVNERSEVRISVAGVDELDELDDNDPAFLIPCITTDPKEMAYASSEFLARCERVGVLIASSVHCPPECGGHWVCWACFDYGTERGLIR